MDAVIERLQYMHDVAAWKWRENAPIADPARERTVMRNARREAQRMGLDADSAVDFFREQILAAKEIQRGWYERWRKGETPPAQIRDLDTGLRPAIGRVGRDIVRLLAIELPELPPRAPARLQREGRHLGLSEARITALYGALVAVRYAPVGSGSLLGYVRARGVLRVGTTGDYRPFSYFGDDAELRGVDVAMAKRLARSLDVDVRWVMTSWPSLAEDLARGRFDIAMSGVTRNLSRQRDGLFSIGYRHGGKTPIARCDDIARYDNLDAIDRPGVRVIVNPGGTNERFARENLEHADVIVHADNTTIFDALIEQRADVMITDAIEVRLQSSVHPELCATMPGATLTHSVKAYWMPRDPIFLDYVNAFVEEALADGTVGALFNQYLPARPAHEAPGHSRDRPRASRSRSPALPAAPNGTRAADSAG